MVNQWRGKVCSVCWALTALACSPAAQTSAQSSPPGTTPPEYTRAVPPPDAGAPSEAETPADTGVLSAELEYERRIASARGLELRAPGNIVFPAGKPALPEGPAAEVALEQVKTFLEATPGVTLLRVEGHSDSRGNAKQNLEASGKRALLVKQWLVARGIAAERLIAVGFGSEKPVAGNSTPAGRAQNRRVEFAVVSLDGVPRDNQTPDGGGVIFQ